MPESSYSWEDFDKEKYISKRRKEMTQIFLEHVNPKKYFKEGKIARSVSAQQFGDGTYFRGQLVGYDPNIKAHIALGSLSEQVSRSVSAHGIASNVPLEKLHDPNFALFALSQILASGIVHGSEGPLSGDINTQVFTDAPFILLSNKGQRLFEYDHNIQENRLTNLRTVLVNGQYESMIPFLKNAFKGVSFRSAEEITDATFDKSSTPFVSFDDQINLQLEKELAIIETKRQST